MTKENKIISGLNHQSSDASGSSGILENKEFIDNLIKNAATDFPIEKINKVDLEILRLAIYELYVVKKEPKKVIIDEAIELAKEYGGNTSPSFINGVLGKLIKDDKNSKI